MLRRLLKLARRRVPIVARGDHVLRDLREPLLDERLPIGLGAVELVLGLDQAVVVELRGPQRFDLRVHRAQKV